MIYILIYVCMYVCLRKFIYCDCMYLYKYIYIHTYIHTYIYRSQTSGQGRVIHQVAVCGISLPDISLRGWAREVPVLYGGPSDGPGTVCMYVCMYVCMSTDRSSTSIICYEHDALIGCMHCRMMRSVCMYICMYAYVCLIISLYPCYKLIST